MASSSFLKVDGALAHVALSPSTGRRHQLRVHCAQGLESPILGDDLHSGDLGEGGEGLSPVGASAAPGDGGGSQQKGSVRRGIGLFLYCRRVSLPHPTRPGEVLSAEVGEPRRFARHREKARKGWEWELEKRRGADAG